MRSQFNIQFKIKFLKNIIKSKGIRKEENTLVSEKTNALTFDKFSNQIKHNSVLFSLNKKLRKITGKNHFNFLMRLAYRLLGGWLIG